MFIVSHDSTPIAYRHSTTSLSSLISRLSADKSCDVKTVVKLQLQAPFNIPATKCSILLLLLLSQITFQPPLATSISTSHSLFIRLTSCYKCNPCRDNINFMMHVKVIYFENYIYKVRNVRVA